MTSAIQILRREWTVQQALILSVVCVTVGVGAGWLIRGGETRSEPAPAQATSTSLPIESASAATPQTPSPAQLKTMADAQAAPLMQRLNSEANNFDLLTAIGNIYYDAQQYSVAVDYYGRALKVKPSEASVRTDMATAYWYMGDADKAIAEFNRALTYAPDNPNTLFNLGLVKWQGKKDAGGAIADWKKLLEANPDYEGKLKVEQMMAQARNQESAKSPMSTR